MTEATVRAVPCRNFCILGAALLPCDPLTGGECYALTSYAGGGTGALILIDPETRTAERYLFPGDEGAWAICFLPRQERLLIGTCAHRGLLHRFDLKSRRFLLPLSLPGERYIWNLAPAENGLVYGGSWPGGVLAEYDPERDTVRNLGHVGSDPENCYTKGVLAAPGGVLVTSGFHSTGVWYYDFSSEVFLQVGGEGERAVFADESCILTEKEGRLFRYTPGNFSLVDSFDSQFPPEDLPESALDFLRQLQLRPFGLQPGEAGSHLSRRACGECIGVKGQDLIWSVRGSWYSMKIPAEPLPCNIMTVMAAPDGSIWGSAEFGQTLFHYDPVAGVSDNTSSVAAAGGEVYGIVHQGGRLFLTAYIGGDHILYDPRQPWDQYGNRNPRLLYSAAPDMVRPHGKSVLGPDGGIWTGWWASYGVRGGGITRIDPESLTVRSWFPIAGDQAIEHLSAGTDCLYAVTSGEASGLMTGSACFSALKLGLDGSILRRYTWPEGITLYKILPVAGLLVVSLADARTGKALLTVLDPDTLLPLAEAEAASFAGSPGEAAARELLDCKNGLCAAFPAGEAVFLDPVRCRITARVRTPGICQTAALAPDGTIWFAVGEKLCSISSAPPVPDAG